MKRLAIVTTHPIQYYAPVFKLLSEQPEIKAQVFYTWGEGSLDKYDPGFGKKVEWDIPLLDGYDYQFLKNTSSKPGSNHFNGIINPDAIAELEKFNPDAILVYGWAYHSHLKIIRYYKGKRPIWFRGDSNLLDQQRKGLKGLLKNVFLKWVYWHIDKAFYVGSANRKYFLKYGVKERKLIFAPHAIDNDRFSRDRSEESERIRKNLGIKSSDILILFAGKLEQKKNPELLIQSFISIKNMPNVHLLMVGNGVLEEKLKSNYCKSPNLHFMPFQNQNMMPVVYQSSDIFCLPSKGPGETWGLAVNEAMACGQAILVSDKVGCAEDLVHHGENGFIFNTESFDSLRKSLQELLSSPDKLKRMGEKSKVIIKDWSFEAFVNAVRQELVKNE